MRKAFTNEPFTDFSVAENAAAFRPRLNGCGRLGETYPLVIGGKKITTDDTRLDQPGLPQRGHRPGEQGHAGAGGPGRPRRSRAFQTWSRVPYAERARYLFRGPIDSPAQTRVQRPLLTLEAGKTWIEADVETAEVIDFLEYYGREMLRLGPPHPTTSDPNHETEMHYIPLGVGVVIPPWNFPLAIMAGMSAAAFVTGNTVVLKPASATPVMAAWIVDLFNEELHLPPGVFNFVPGSGSAVGDVLVDHPLTRFIAFTGSKEIGIRVFQRAAAVQPGQKWLKRTVLEMGGKDAILVDETADLDEAAAGIVSAAFGYSGQKCSACSRAVVVESVYERCWKVIARTQKLDVRAVRPRRPGWARLSMTALAKHLEYIEIGKEEGRLVVGGQALPNESGGYFSSRRSSRTHRAGCAAWRRRKSSARCFERHQGARLRGWAGDCEQHRVRADGRRFISMRRDRLERADGVPLRQPVASTASAAGALVGVQPFGGFNMSGTDSKAGGPDYLSCSCRRRS